MNLLFGGGKLCRNKPASSLKVRCITAPNINEHDRQKALFTTYGSIILKFINCNVHDSFKGRCMSHATLLSIKANAELSQCDSLRSTRKERI